ncbi:MAG: response regulator [Candidatus Zixiibacteriota bacterium]
MESKKRILFVDDDPNVLHGLRRMLHRMRDMWDMEFVESGELALDRLEEQQFDVVVSDMRMPGMNGAQLLEQIQQRHPQTVRLILSGYSDQELVLRSVGPAHQFLAKPCDADTLVQCVKRSCALREFLSNQFISTTIGRIKALPVLPSVYTELLNTLADEEASLADVGRIISRDVGMSAKILQLVNSAFFGLRQEIEDPSRAVMFLGLDTIKSLVLSVSVFSSFDAGTVEEFSVDGLQLHSLGVGALAKQLAMDAGLDIPSQEDTFCAGIMHDIGKLILIANFPDEYRQVLSQVNAYEPELVNAERDTIGTDHAQLGGYLLALWGLPDPIVEAVTLHPTPGISPNRVIGPLAFVHVADLLEHELSARKPSGHLPYDQSYLRELGLEGELPRYRQIAESFLYDTVNQRAVG